MSSINKACIGADLIIINTEWDEFKDLLIEQIRLSGETPEQPNLAKPGYYEFWIKNLEKLLERNKNITQETTLRGE